MIRLFSILPQSQIQLVGVEIPHMRDIPPFNPLPSVARLGELGQHYVFFHQIFQESEFASIFHWNTLAPKGTPVGFLNIFKVEGVKQTSVQCSLDGGIFPSIVPHGASMRDWPIAASEFGQPTGVFIEASSSSDRLTVSVGGKEIKIEPLGSGQLILVVPIEQPVVETAEFIQPDGSNLHLFRDAALKARELLRVIG